MAGLGRTTKAKLYWKDIILANGETSSEDFTTGSFVIGAILIPTGLTGTSLSFYGYIDDSATSYILTDFHDGTATFTVTPAANSLIPIDFRKTASIGRWKIVSNAPQIGAITLKVLLREID